MMRSFTQDLENYQEEEDQEVNKSILDLDQDQK